MPVGLRYDLYQPTFQKKSEESRTVRSFSDLDKIPGVETMNNTITDFANQGKIKSRKALNSLMTIGLGVAAFFTGKRITKSVMDSLCHHTVYLNSFANGVETSFKFIASGINKLNPENGSPFVRSIKQGILGVPQKVRNFARTGLHKDIELEKYAKELNLKSVDELSEIDLARFETKYCNTIAKNGISKVVASSLGILTGVETFIEVGADKNKNGIPDLFEQKTYKQIMEIAQPKIDEKVIEQVRKINIDDDENEIKELD